MTDLFARKGEAEPLYLDAGVSISAPFPGGMPEFRHRRSLAMASPYAPTNEPAPWESRGPTGRTVGTDRRPLNRPPLMAPRRSAAGEERRRFTFRLDPDRHRRFGLLAALRGVSRQKLLTEILDRALADAEAAGLAKNPGGGFGRSGTGGRGHAV